jgi:RNA polymerase sigma factor (sigma-70 family)
MAAGDEKELLRRAWGGDMDAYGELFERSRPALRGKLRQIVHNSHDVEDLEGETFLRARAAIKQFRGDASATSWFCRIGINLGWDHHRKASSHPHDTLSGSFPEGLVRSPLENPQGGRTRSGGSIERYSAFKVEENEKEHEEQHDEEAKRKENNEILDKGFAGLSTREREVIIQLFFTPKRIPAKQLAANLGFADPRKIYEIRRKFTRLCGRAREEIRRSKKSAPPVDRSP